MNRFASIVGSAAAFAAASLCSAQTARPYMYIWADPGSSWNAEIAGHVSQVVRFGADWFNNPTTPSTPVFSELLLDLPLCPSEVVVG